LASKAKGNLCDKKNQSTLATKIIFLFSTISLFRCSYIFVQNFKVCQSPNHFGPLFWPIFRTNGPPITNLLRMCNTFGIMKTFLYAPLNYLYLFLLPCNLSP
jgi:hypothetical protein